MADLHEIVKGKFVALKGPHMRSYFKDGVQFLAPSHYFELFRKLNVTAVVRLNDEQVYLPSPASLLLCGPPVPLPVSGCAVRPRPWLKT